MEDHQAFVEGFLDPGGLPVHCKGPGPAVCEEQRKRLSHAPCPAACVSERRHALMSFGCAADSFKKLRSAALVRMFWKQVQSYTLYLQAAWCCNGCHQHNQHGKALILQQAGSVLVKPCGGLLHRCPGCHESSKGAIIVENA